MGFDMGMLLIIIGAACVGAGIFGKSALKEKQIPVLVVGVLLLGGGFGLLSPGSF